MLPKEGGFKGLRVQYQRDAIGRGVRVTFTYTHANTQTSLKKKRADCSLLFYDSMGYKVQQCEVSY